MQASPSSQAGRRRRAAPTMPALPATAGGAAGCRAPARGRRRPGAVGGDGAREGGRRCRSTSAPCRRCVPSSWASTCRRRWTSPRRCTRRTRRRRIRARIRAICPRACWPRCRPCLDSLVKTDPSLRPLIDRLDRQQRSRAWNDGKVTAHHGIIPTLEPANLSAMSDKELAVHRLIRAHYLAQFLPHHEFDRTVAQLTCGGQSLVAVGKQIAVAGWRQVLAAPVPGRHGDGEDDAARPDCRRCRLELPARSARSN